jgi:uncharacterized integral membrane protein
MQVLLALVALLLLGVAIFAFQNPDPVIVRFLRWEISASVAVVTLAATASGALAAALASLATRLVRWSRRPAPVERTAGGGQVPLDPPPPALP